MIQWHSKERKVPPPLIIEPENSDKLALPINNASPPVLWGSRRKTEKSNVIATPRFSFIDPPPKNYKKHLHLFTIIDEGNRKNIVFFKREKQRKVEGNNNNNSRRSSAEDLENFAKFGRPNVERFLDFPRLDRCSHPYAFEERQNYFLPCHNVNWVYNKRGLSSKRDASIICNNKNEAFVSCKERAFARKCANDASHRHVVGAVGSFSTKNYASTCKYDALFNKNQEILCKNDSTRCAGKRDDKSKADDDDDDDDDDVPLVKKYNENNKFNRDYLLNNFRIYHRFNRDENDAKYNNNNKYYYYAKNYLLGNYDA